MARDSAAGLSSAGAVIDALLATPQGLTRSELRDATGLSAATLVGLLKNPSNGNGSARSGSGRNGKAAQPGRLAELVDQPATDSGGEGRRAGAPAARHRVRPDKAYILGIDLGRHHVAAAAGDALGRVLERPGTQEPWVKRTDSLDVDSAPWEALDTAADFVADLVAELEHERGIHRGEFAGIGVAVTSAIEPTGLFRPGWMADAWHGVRPIKELEERLRARGLACPLVIDKDANLAALAEQRWGVGAGTSDFVWVKWAHGLSAGVVMRGELVRGAGGSAGAFGHSPIVKVEREPDEREDRPSRVWGPEDGFKCRRCGKTNCLEAVIGIDRLVREVSRARRLGDDDPQPTIDEIKRAARNDRTGEEAKILRAAAKRLGNALGAVVNLLNPAFVVIGGSFGRDDYDFLASPVQQGLQHVAIAPTYRDVDVRFTDQNVIAGTLAALIDHGEVTSFLLRKVA